MTAISAGVDGGAVVHQVGGQVATAPAALDAQQTVGEGNRVAVAGAGKMGALPQRLQHG